MDFKGIGCEDFDFIHMAQVLVNTVMDLQFP
jgi:predicted glycosyltransferase involved in capsule biosynthesis